MPRGVTQIVTGGYTYVINDMNTAGEFSTGTSYAKGSYCYRGGYLWRFLNDHSGAWVPADAEQVALADDVTALRGYAEGTSHDLGELDTRVHACESAIGAVTQDIAVPISLQLGRYGEDGYNWTTDKYAVADGYLEPGKYYLPIMPTGYLYAIYYYDSDSQGTQLYNYGGNTIRDGVTIARNAKISFRKSDVSTLSSSDLTYIQSNFEPRKYFTPEPRQYVAGIPTDVLTEIYLPDVTGWTLNRIRAKSTMFRIGINMPDGSTVINGGDDVGTEYSDAVQRLVDTTTGETIGWYVLHYTGTDYESAIGTFAPNEAFTSNISLCPIIRDYLNRKENLVLIGDSIFGYQNENMLAQMLRKRSDKQVFNCGFGGCAMTTRGNNYDPLSFARIADSIASGDFSIQAAAITLQNIYPYRYADLTGVNWNKPTTIIVDYINNDLTSGVPLGNPWSDGETANSWDTGKFVEAMTYGLSKIIGRYPKTRVIFLTAKWRYINDVPLYQYTNSAGLKAADYNAAMKENAERIGVSVFDFTTQGGANAFNKNTMMISGASHFTLNGYRMFAELLDKLDRSPMM